MLKEKNWEELEELLQRASVPRNTVIDERPFEQTDFTVVTDLSKECFVALESSLSIFNETKIQDLDPCQQECIYRSLLLCGEHSADDLWTNEECKTRSERVLTKIIAALHAEDLSSFLSAFDSKSQLHGVNLFVLLTPKLSANEWKYHPAAVRCYRWLLGHIKSQMGDFLNVVIPVPLNLINDHQIENKVIALESLSIILRNVSNAQLNWYIQIELLRNILKPLFYYREADLIVPLVECMLEVVAKTDSPFIDVEDLQWGYLDDILTILLPMMEYEQNIYRRCAYSVCLHTLLKRKKISIARWCPKILRIIDDYSKTPMTEFAAMNALNEYTLNCWPFIKDHWRFINVIAGRILYRSTNEEAIKVSEKVVRRLHQCVPPNFEMKNVEYIVRKRRNIE